MFSVKPRVDIQIIYIFDLVSGHKIWSHRCKGVVAFISAGIGKPLVSSFFRRTFGNNPFPCCHGASEQSDHCVPCSRIHNFQHLFINETSLFRNDKRHLGFRTYIADFFWNFKCIIRTYYTGRNFNKVIRMFWPVRQIRYLVFLPIVDSDGENFGRAGIGAIYVISSGA